MPTSLDELIDDIARETDHPTNPYLVALAESSFERADFLETQIQFHSAVVFFSRPMAAVAAKIPSRRLRVEVLRNVWEEHGEGHESDQHGSTFLEFLRRLGGVEEADIDRRPLWPEVRMFNTTLTGACVMDDYRVGVGVMGMIEFMFSDISARIGQAIVHHGWLSADRLTHYSLHRELDIKHAADFFDVLRPAWDEGTSSRYSIEQGLRLGAYAFDTLYRGLFAARARRWICEAPGDACRD